MEVLCLGPSYRKKMPESDPETGQVTSGRPGAGSLSVLQTPTACVGAPLLPWLMGPGASFQNPHLLPLL